MKIKYNLKNVHLFPISAVNADGSVTYETTGSGNDAHAVVIPWPGAVSIALDPQGELSPFYADGIEYYTSNGNNGYSGPFTSAIVPDEVAEKILGDVVDGNGAFIENADAQVKYFGIAFEFDGDASGRRHILYKCSMTRPRVESQTKEDRIEPVTDEVTLTASSVYIPTLGKYTPRARLDKDKNATAYASWFEAAYQPVAPSQQPAAQTQ